MGTVVSVLLIAASQVLCIYVAYGAKLWGVRIPGPIALGLLLASPFVASYGEFRATFPAVPKTRDRIAISVAVTLLATYLGLFLAVNRYGS